MWVHFSDETCSDEQRRPFPCRSLDCVGLTLPDTKEAPLWWSRPTYGRRFDRLGANCSTSSPHQSHVTAFSGRRCYSPEALEPAEREPWRQRRRGSHKIWPNGAEVGFFSASKTFKHRNLTFFHSYAVAYFTSFNQSLLDVFNLIDFSLFQ